MSTAAANTFPSRAGSTDTGIAEAERVTATVNSEEAVEAGLFAATATAQTQVGRDAATPDARIDACVPPKCIPPVFERMPPELKLLKNGALGSDLERVEMDQAPYPDFRLWGEYD